MRSARGKGAAGFVPGGCLRGRGAATPMASAGAESLATISGTVTRAVGGTPVVGVCVDITSFDEFSHFDSGVTNVSGQYTIPRVPPGEYEVEFNPCSDQTLVGEYWDNEHGDPTMLVVTDGGNHTGIDVALEPEGEGQRSADRQQERRPAAPCLHLRGP